MSKHDFDGSQVIETRSFVFFWQPPAVFGQWTRSTFVADGETYTCAEQYMMAEKARLFGDARTRARILASDDPKTHKQLGRQVQGFDHSVWEAHRVPIVVAGNQHKFAQNPDMRAALIASGDKILVEASPLDRVWGVGLRADDARIMNPGQWRGQNLLGLALMMVRSELTR